MNGPLLLCARQELTLAIRSRWTQLFAIVFALLASAVAWSGYILSGGSGVQDFARTSVSMIQLVTLLVPLAALVVGVMSFTAERGAAELLYSQPVSRASILSGQMLGVFVALVAAQLVGFGAAGIVIFSSGGSWGVGAYFVLVSASVLLTAMFVAAAAAAGAGAVGRGRLRAIAVALTIWFAAVLLFDLAALGAASLLPSGHASRLLIVSVLVNPVDAIRTGALLATTGTTAFGAASLAFLRFTKGTTGAMLALSISIVFWTIAPALLATWRLRKRDL
ncbi:MAG TPA: ABC transporter permease subunit [Thermoanaerobaculia bacterium]|nr:ABC transporter permease subunit [Thermoanaerobaculia bacterium]